jgi:hypothetical protein
VLRLPRASPRHATGMMTCPDLSEVVKKSGINVVADVRNYS